MTKARESLLVSWAVWVMDKMVFGRSCALKTLFTHPNIGIHEWAWKHRRELRRAYQLNLLMSAPGTTTPTYDTWIVERYTTLGRIALHLPRDPG